MENNIINSYTPDTFFHHYYSNNEEWMNRYESPLLDYVKSSLPNYVNTIINFGCANGRDFLPFHEDYNCIGFDLASPSIIKWACKTDNLTYYQCSVEDYLDKFNHENIDLSSCLVYTQGTLMYVSYENQNRFINHLINQNCKNIVFHEYPPECIFGYENGVNPLSNFNPNLDLLNLFERKHFRSIVERQPTGFLYLNK